MRDTKGFTLIELLAVIVILAIVALVTTPAILSVINDSRMKGAQDKAWGTIEAVKLAFSQAQSKDDNTLDSFDGKVTFGSGGTSNIGGTPITMSGERPSGGQVIIDLNSGKVTATNLKFTGNGTYTCSTDDGGNKMCCEKGTGTVSCS